MTVVAVVGVKRICKSRAFPESSDVDDDDDDNDSDGFIHDDGEGDAGSMVIGTRTHVVYEVGGGQEV